MSVSLSALHTRAIVLDIEGTTTPVEFVHQVLFSFARTHAAQYLQREWESTPCREIVAQLREEQARDPGVAQDAGAARDFGPASILAYVRWLMDRDRKSPGLKALQGLIWQDGYRSGELRGEVYADVPPALERWRARGISVYIHSSGSVLAQQLLFESTEAGDLTRFLTGYFDTGVGPKNAPDSYRTIAGRIGVPAPQILFVSDVVAELDAAAATEMHTALCVRGGGDAPPGSVGHPLIRTFEEIS